MGAATPFVPAIITAVLGAGTVAVEANQAKKAQEGAQNAAKDQQNQLNQQIDLQKKTDANNLNQQQTQAGASQQAAINAIRAAMSANSGMGGTILTGPQGASTPSIASKTLLGG
jgi:Sec-independent protein translocase protein TatA